MYFKRSMKCFLQFDLKQRNKWKILIKFWQMDYQSKLNDPFNCDFKFIKVILINDIIEISGVHLYLYTLFYTLHPKSSFFPLPFI